MTLHMSSVRLRTAEKGGTGALTAFLAGSAQAIGQAHHLVWSLFNDHTSKRNFVYRLTGSDPSQPILVYSQTPVTDPHNLWDIRTAEFTLADTLKPGDQVTWSIRVNATTRVDSKRHDLVMHARRSIHRDEPVVDWDAIAARVVPPWTERKLAAAGLEAPASKMHVESYVRRRFGHDPRRRHDPPVTIATTDLRGIGTVRDADALQQSLARGIGPGGAYGCGMLLLRRAS